MYAAAGSFLPSAVCGGSHATAQSGHHGCGGARFSQLQLSLSRRPEGTRCRLHGGADSRHRRAYVPARARGRRSIRRASRSSPSKSSSVWCASATSRRSGSPTPTSRTSTSCTRRAGVIAWGAHFGICSATRTMLRSSKPVIAVTAVRTGVGKSQTTRYLSRILRQLGKRVVAIRHPMPYGDLAQQICQRFETYADLDRHAARSRSARSTSRTSTTASWSTPASTTS